MITVSQSKVKAWRRCRQEYHFKYNERLRKRKKKRALTFGTILHKMLEDHAEGLDPFDTLKLIEKKNGKMFRAEVEEYGDIIADSKAIMEGYFDYYKDDEISHLPVKKKYAEHQLKVEIAKGVMMTGKVDFIARYRGQRVLGEHKTFTRVMNDDDRWRNLQSSVYIRAIDVMGWKPVEGTLWDNIRSKPPTQPSLLKNGSLSRAKIDTLPSSYLAAIKEHGLKVEDYDDVLDVLNENRKSWFIREFTPRNDTVVDEVVKDFVASAREIERFGNDAPVANIGFNCGMCDYEPLCRARFQAFDVDFIKKREYTNEREEDLV